jgi:hypothetical protein
MKLNTIQHPKLFRLKRRLSLQTWGAVGILESLWNLTATHAKDGALGKTFTNEDIANYIGWEADPEVLIEALVSSGWLDICETNRLVVHDWHDHCPEFVKGNIRRMKKEFAKTPNSVPNSVPYSVPNSVAYSVGNSVPYSVPNSVANPVPYSKPSLAKTSQEPPITPPGGEVVSVPKFNPKLVSIPEALVGEAFKVAWESWCDYRTETRKGIKHRTAKAQLAELAGWGPEAAVQSINQSIRNGWTGLFPPTGTTTTPRPTRPAAPLASSTMDPKLAEEIFGIRPKPNGVHLLPEGPSNG